MSAFRILEDGLKSCLIDGKLASTCGCPQNISQADRHIKQHVVTGVPPLIRLGGLPKGMKGNSRSKFTMTWEIVRNEDGSVTNKCIEFRPATAAEAARA